MADDSIVSIAQRLADWSGSDAEVVEYATSHQKLTLRLSAPERLGTLLVRCSPCPRIAGPTHWKDCDLRVAVTVESKKFPTHVLFDPGSGFVAICGGVSANPS